MVVALHLVLLSAQHDRGTKFTFFNASWQDQNWPTRKLTPGLLVIIPAGQLYQLDNTGDEDMILLGARAEAAAKPRFSGDDQGLRVHDYAPQNLESIHAPEEKKQERAASIDGRNHV